MFCLAKTEIKNQIFSFSLAEAKFRNQNGASASFPLNFDLCAVYPKGSHETCLQNKTRGSLLTSNMGWVLLISESLYPPRIAQHS